MIRVLGTKRILILVFLVAVNVSLAAGVYMYLTPDLVKKEREVRGLRGQISTLRSDIARLEVEFDQLELQQAEFDLLKERGFFGAQGRREAELLFEKIQQEAGVVSAKASVRAGEFEASEEAAKADHKILKSPIDIKIDALDDVSVFKYIYLVEKFFPGHIMIENLTLERVADVNSIVLRGIASGANPVLVKADLRMIWRTMIPQSDVIDEDGGSL